ncbi:MAG TPA: hypothetical protein VFF06_04685 [Polyangia bacterium]|nr:hypothetical protein [Polyangia bacterium]
MRVHSLVLVGVLAVGGCGDDLTVMNPDGGGNDLAVGDLAGTVDISIPLDFRAIVTASMFNKDLAQAICMQLVTCGRLDAANMAACVEAHTPNLSIDLDSEAMKGRIQFNEAQCLAAIAGSRCDGEDIGEVFISKCRDLVDIPKEPSDGTSACLASAECINGYCAHGSADAGLAPEGCPGICQPFKVLNATCAIDAECDAVNAYCDSGTKKCTMRPGANGDCTMVGCQPNLYCNGGKCTAPTPTGTTAGAPCNTLQNFSTDTPACGPTFFCKMVLAPTISGTCAAKIAMGSPCTPADTPFGGDNQCVDGSVCAQIGTQTMHTCQAYGSLNADCDPAAGSCKDALYCDSTTKKCLALLADGASCNPAANHCIANSQHGNTNCIGATPVCVPEKLPGDACNPATESPACGSNYCDPNKSTCGLLCN